MMRYRLAWPTAAALGLLLDRAFGEPPAPLHPVGWFGQAMLVAERAGDRDSRAAGGMHALTGVLVGAGAGALVRSAALSTGLAVAGRSLGESALTVGRALDRGDLGAARAGLPALVGRDPAGLDEAEMARAVVESVAENTVERGGGTRLLGRRLRGARRSRLPGGQHDGRHGRPPQREVPRIRLGERPAG